MTGPMTATKVRQGLEAGRRVETLTRERILELMERMREAYPSFTFPRNHATEAMVVRQRQEIRDLARAIRRDSAYDRAVARGEAAPRRESLRPTDEHLFYARVEGASPEVYGRGPQDHDLRAVQTVHEEWRRLMLNSPSRRLRAVPGQEVQVAEDAADAVDMHVRPSLAPEQRKESFEAFQKRAAQELRLAEENHR